MDSEQSSEVNYRRKYQQAMTMLFWMAFYMERDSAEHSPDGMMQMYIKEFVSPAIEDAKNTNDLRLGGSYE